MPFPLTPIPSGHLLPGNYVSHLHGRKQDAGVFRDNISELPFTSLVSFRSLESNMCPKWDHAATAVTRSNAP